jgi:2-phosphoglycerate kinase
MRKIILIGGAPTSGKSYTARVIAEDLKLPWISTDTIREQMRGIVRKDDYPNLFIFNDSDPKQAVEYLSEATTNKIVDDQNKESGDVWKGLKALIENDYVWDDFVVEGVAILPSFIPQLSDNNIIIPFFLTDNNKRRIRETIFTRGLWNEASKYPDSVKEKEVEWVLAFDQWIRKESKKYGYKTFDIINRTDHIHEVSKYVKTKLHNPISF